ncbi:MAG TPA: hypothetical protein VKT73_04195 [Xanthobacteraceae bacterium]|nr:hypothetical protein [Xanthobacteraceae bacterium]
MTDYQPLLARAIDGLERNTGEARRAIYDRARQALLNQLRAVNPPLADPDITRERLALEDAIRKVETQATQANPETIRAPRPPSAAPRPPSVSPRSPAAPAVSREPAPAIAQPRPPETRAPMSATPRVAVSPAARGPVPPGPSRNFERPIPQAPEVPPAPPRDRENGDGRRVQREPYRPIPPAHAGTRLDDDLDYPLEDESEDRLNAPRIAPGRVDRPELPDEFDVSPRARRLQPPPGVRPRAEGGGLRTKLLAAGVVVLLFAAVALFAYVQRDRILALLGVGPGSGAVAVDPDRPKTDDRVSPQVNAPTTSGPTAPSANTPPAVGQAATLYEENPGGAQQFQNFPGTVVWRTETVSVGPGRAPDLALRVDIDIPDRKMNVSLLLRRNMDASFPASHTLEIQFNTPGDPFGGISTVRGMRAKNAEAANGSVLIMSEPEKIKDGDILFALPDTQLEQNVQLLRERPWFDIAFFYNNGRRAVLAFEKGTPGEQAISNALAAWGQGG